jgi:glycosyltransferase involved in cell wall biosynthesis
MIRVCHVITQLELGGAQQNTLHTVRHLDRARFDPVLVSGPGGVLDAEAAAGGVAWHVVPELRREISPARDLAALARLTRLMRRLAPRIVHTHSSKAGILGRWAATLAGVPHIVHSIHGYGFHPGQGWLTRGALVSLERITGRLATSAFVAVSRENLRTGLDLELFDARHVSLIRSGVPLADFSPRTEARPAGAPLTVGMIACLKRQKAPVDFVEVASRVVRDRGASLAPVRFVLVGDGALRGEVERAVARAGLGGVVHLAGWRRDIPEVLRGFDVMLHTSRWEGLPRVFPEAMATGLPIVATRVDGAPEAIEEGVTGYLLEPGDVEGLARRVGELLEDEPLRRRLGAQALSRVEPWDIDAMVRRQERLYEDLVAKGVEIAVARSTQEEANG